jgi:Protein of unknown function (DUF2630)
MDDVDILHRIGQLSDEERELEESHIGESLSAADVARRREIEVTLDQCWDLLRQRRARREAGQDPDAVAVRPEAVVEGYQQ